MKNYEKYADEIKNYKGDNFCTNFVKPNILKSEYCVDDMTCDVCRMIQAIWLMEEYKEPEEPKVDWSKVKVDTPILVRQVEKEEWIKRHFAKYENGLVYTWKDSRTSWTSLYEEEVTAWKYAKLAEDKEKCKEPKVDWSKVRVDTPVLVNDCEDGDWYKRYFAEYENGMVYTWDNGYTSHGTSIVTGWKYAKLAEGEEEKE